MKKLVSLLLALVMVLSLAACAGQNNGGINAGNQGGGNGPSGTLRIAVANFGYGTDWLQSLAQVYMAKNRNAKIIVEGTVIPYQLLQQIEGGFTKYDIFFGTAELHYKSEYFVELSDLYASVPEGENKTIEEKIGSLTENFRYNGKYYAVPYVMSPTGMVVNEDTMREVYGEDYPLPNTTNEMLAIFDELKAKNVVPFIDTSTGYVKSLIQTWFIQYDSVGYHNYYTGYYIDENGETQRALNAESMMQPGKEIAMQLGYTLLDSSLGYNHPYAGSMDFAEAQIAFCGHGYGSIDERKIAFTPNGAWLENEMELTLEEYPVDLRMFRVPVISEIINVLPDQSVANDAELSALITAIDAGSTSLSGSGYEVTQNDFDRVREARSYVDHVSDGHQAGIVKTCQSVELAKDFLRFLASDAASSLAMDELDGLTLAYGYTPAEDQTAECSYFIQSVYDTIEGCTWVNHHGTDKLNGLNLAADINGLASVFLIGEKDGKTVYKEDIQKYQAQGKYMLATEEN